jgi:hypothetical protein
VRAVSEKTYKQMTGFSGVVCQMDNVLVFGSDRAQHDARLLTVLQRIDESAQVTLNAQKCKFTKTSVKFLGHTIDQAGIWADPEKTSAIRKMRPLIQILRKLLGENSTWVWGPSQSEEFSLVKELSKPTILALYHLKAPTKFSLSECILPWPGNRFRVETIGVCVTLNDRHRAAILTNREGGSCNNLGMQEKEALAITWACKKKRLLQ